MDAVDYITPMCGDVTCPLCPTQLHVEIRLRELNALPSPTDEEE